MEHKYSTIALVFLLIVGGLFAVLGDWDDAQYDGVTWLFPEDGDHVYINPLYHEANNSLDFIEFYNNRTYINNEQYGVFITKTNKTAYQYLYALGVYINGTNLTDMVATIGYVNNATGYPANTTNWNMTICIEGNCTDIYPGRTSGSEGDITAVNTNGPYLTGGSDTGDVSLLINETMLNTTINALDSDTTYNSEEIYIYELSNTFYLNETKLNTTIEVLSDMDTNTWWSLTGYMINDSGNLNINETMLNATIEALDIYGDLHTHNQDLNTTNNVIFNFTNLTGSLLVPQENNDDNPEIAFGDGDTGFYEISANYIGMTFAGTKRYNFAASLIESSTAGRWRITQEDPSSTNPVYTFNGDDDTGIGRNDANELSLITGGTEHIRLVNSTNQILINANQNYTQAENIQYYANGCIEIMNSTGWYQIC